MIHSRKIIRQKKFARKVESSLHNHKAQIVAGLVDYYTPYLAEGETLPDFETFLDLQARVIRHHRLELQAKDRAHQAELDNDKALRRVRDAAARQLFKKMGEIVRTVDGAYGVDRCQELLGFGTGLTDEPEQVVEGAEKAIERIDADFAFPDAELEGFDLNVEDVRKQLDEPYTDVATAIFALDDEKDKFDASVNAKQAAAKALGTVFVRHSRLTEDLYRIGGADELADSLRPSTHRSKQVSAEQASGDSDATDSDATDSKAEAADATDSAAPGAVDSKADAPADSDSKDSGPGSEWAAS